jgi:steroid delta-isomerase-like uncharacterized protein
MATETTATSGAIDLGWLADFADRYLDAWNSHEPDRLLELMCEDIVYDDSAWPETMRSHAEVREFLEHTWSSMPDLSFEMVEGPFVHPTEPKAMASWRGTGTFKGRMDPPGFAPTGQQVAVEGVDYHEYRDGKLGRLVILFDTATMGRQIGAMPQPGSRAERMGVLMQRLAARRMRKPG